MRSYLIKNDAKNCSRASKSLPNLSQKHPKTLPKPIQNPFKVAPKSLKIVSTENVALSANNTDSENDLLVHKVTKGETISTISALYGVTESHLKKMNPDVIKGNTVYYGTRLKIIPSESYKGSASAADNDVNTSPKYYKIRRGDNLISISRKFGVSVNSIKSKNKNLNENALQIGQRIRIQ